MLHADVALDGYPQVLAQLARAADLGSAVHALLVARAEEGKERLARATPVRTGTAQRGWAVLPIDADSLAIVNPVLSADGYSYPTGLITGTGGRAQPTFGYLGTHNPTWHGMAPSTTLHRAWEVEVVTGFTLPATLLGGLP